MRAAAQNILRNTFFRLLAPRFPFHTKRTLVLISTARSLTASDSGLGHQAYYSVQVKSGMSAVGIFRAENFGCAGSSNFHCRSFSVSYRRAKQEFSFITPPRGSLPGPSHASEPTGFDSWNRNERQSDWRGWVDRESFELRAPILNFTIAEMLDDDFRSRVANVLKFWISYDVENLVRIKCGIPHFQIPYEYETNRAEAVGGLITHGRTFLREFAPACARSIEGTA